ncbi:hypothetical protein CGI16_23115 [Vibrio parahaemolyticus]|nr:hypothetical protein CGI19_20300 [Vibrio parahaemolyticus]TOK51912.1 hypothetical protein CGI16_23115 [Vibrio parahaemolyticus]
MLKNRQSINELFEMWARWCLSGSDGAPASASLMQKLIENKGVMCFGSGKGAPVVDCIEARIEAAVMKIAARDKVTAQVLRREYFSIEDNEPLTQVRKAHSLGISLRTYERRLNKGRAFVLSDIGLKEIKRP